MVPDASAEHYAGQQRLTVATLGLARTAWRQMGSDFDASWRTVGPQLELIAMSAQLGAARGADPYLRAVLPELGMADDPVAQVVPRAFVGTAGDGRPVASLLYGAVTAAKAAQISLPLVESLARGGRFLDMATHTLVADTSRDAVSSGITARPNVAGWVRMLRPPSCPQCVVLAGKWFRWNRGFQRHPRCDCYHVPAGEGMAGALTTSAKAAVEAGQVRGLSAADSRAVADGADVARVVNAHRGMSTAQVAGRSVSSTAEAAGRGVRLRPEGIYQVARDRDDALRLLARFGYLTT